MPSADHPLSSDHWPVAEEPSLPSIFGPAKPVLLRPASDIVFDELRNQILGGLKPGSPLRLAEIAQHLNVSTTPVREALARLEAEGMIVHVPRRGAVVAPLSVADLLDIYAIRMGLESEAALRGAPALQPPQFAQMQALFERLSAPPADSASDPDAYLETDCRLHGICFTASGHPRLVAEIRRYRRQSERYLRIALSDPSQLRDDLRYQRDFLGACERRDGEAAADQSREMLRWTIERVGPVVTAHAP